MSGKRRRPPRSGPVFSLSAEENTLRQMPKYNAHAMGTGPHGDRKYNRAKMKRQWRKDDSAGVSVYSSPLRCYRHALRRESKVDGALLVRSVDARASAFE